MPYERPWYAYVPHRLFHNLNILNWIIIAICIPYFGLICTSLYRSFVVYNRVRGVLSKIEGRAINGGTVNTPGTMRQRSLHAKARAKKAGEHPAHHGHEHGHGHGHGHGHSRDDSPHDGSGEVNKDQEAYSESVMRKPCLGCMSSLCRHLRVLFAWCGMLGTP